jgi:hypothetical protein
MASSSATAALASGRHRVTSNTDGPMVCAGCFNRAEQHVEVIRLALNHSAEL